MNFKGKDCIHVPQGLAAMANALTVPASEELSTFVAPSSSSAESVVSGRHLMSTRSCAVCVTIFSNGSIIWTGFKLTELYTLLFLH